MATSKRVVLVGATGLIGKRLAEHLLQRGYELVVFSRDPIKARRKTPGAAEYIAWTAAEHGEWSRAIDGAYAVINLAGAPIFGKRWTASYRTELWDSRVVGTRGLVNAVAAASNKPLVFIGGSAVGYYGFCDDTKLDEQAGPGADFLARLCAAWEAESLRAENYGVRTVLLRTGIVLDPKEGALQQMMLPFRFFAGGPILPGSQWLSWIHVDDEVGLIRMALEDKRVHGPINITAPQPVTNRAFSRLLGKVMRRPSWLPVPGFVLRIVFGQLASILVAGQRAIPAKAESLGYQFLYPDVEQALRQILKKPT